MMSEKKYFNTREALAYLSCGQTFLWKIAKEGLITPRKVAGKRYYSIAELDELLDTSVSEEFIESNKEAH